MIADQKFITLISSRLKKFKKLKKGLWNFRCPICGDSKKDKNKTRGYFHVYKNDMWFKCHNGCPSKPFSVFLKDFDPVLYEEYIFDKFNRTKRDVVSVPDVIKEKPKFKVSDNKNFYKGIIKLSDIPDHISVKKYILDRKIPQEYINEMYVTDKFKTWTNGIIPDKFRNTKNDEPRLIIPFYDKDKKLFAYQGRSLKKNSGAKYITIKLDESMPKIYGLDRVDLSKRVYIVEGPIDSMFVENCVGASGSDLNGMMFDDYVYVFDNQPRNKEVVNIMQRKISNNENIVIWTKKGKDINDMILSGELTINTINSYLDSRTFNGLSAEIEFNKWRKV